MTKFLTTEGGSKIGLFVPVFQAENRRKNAKTKSRISAPLRGAPGDSPHSPRDSLLWEFPRGMPGEYPRQGTKPYGRPPNAIALASYGLQTPLFWGGWLHRPGGWYRYPAFGPLPISSYNTWFTCFRSFANTRKLVLYELSLEEG